MHSAYFAKNSLKLLNRDNVFWIDIIEHKYNSIFMWHFKIPPKVSWIFRSLCKTLGANKSNCISVLEDPWIFNMPIRLKPTFVNMDINFDSLQLNNFILNDWWDHSFIQHFLSPLIRPAISNLSNIDFSNHNLWTWSSSSLSCSIVLEIYKSLNSTHVQTNPWRVGRTFGKLRLPQEPNSLSGFCFMGG